MIAQVAAIIPTHDRAALLSTTLRSVLWQRDVELEAIVVDDGSSDGTSEVVARLGDPRVRLVRNETPQGVSAARNRGAAEAKARWLAFCDDDDLWAPDKLARQVADAEGSGRRWAYGGAVHVSIDLRVMSAHLPPSPDRLVARLPSWNLMPGGSSNVIVRADAFESRGGWDHGLVNLADWDLWARLAQDGLPAEVRAPLVGYRIHDGNASGDIGLILREATPTMRPVRGTPARSCPTQKGLRRGRSTASINRLRPWSCCNSSTRRVTSAVTDGLPSRSPPTQVPKRIGALLLFRCGSSRSSCSASSSPRSGKTSLSSRSK